MNPVLLAIIGIPALAVFLLIKVGGKIGALNTISLIFLTAIVGIYFAKIEGVKTLKSGIINIYQNQLPIYEIASGASIAVAAILLIIPGFVTDVSGFLLLVPLTRKFLFNNFFKKKSNPNKEKNEVLDGEIIEDKNKENEL